MRRRARAVLKNRGAPPGRGARSQLPNHLLKVVLVGAAYYVSARLGLDVALVERNVTPLWPPTGIAVVAFLILGRAMWPGVAVAAFLVNEPISTSLLAAAATAVGNTIAPLVAVDLLARVGFRTELDRLRDAIAIVFLAALASMLISASIGTATLVFSGALPSSRFLAAGAVWWTGDAMGVLVVAPFLLSLLLFRRRGPISWARRVEAAGLFVALAALSVAVTQARMSLLFLLLPFVGWAAWRFQQRGAAPAALLVAGAATWAAAHGLGPFSQETLLAKMVTLQVFNATVAFTSFVFAAVVTERMRGREALEGAAAELEERVRQRTSELSDANERLTREMAERQGAERRVWQRERQLAEAQQVARIGSWEWMIEENRVGWSDEMYRIHGYRPQEFPLTFDKAVERVAPEDLRRIQESLSDALAKGIDHELPDIEYRIRRTDGAKRVLLGRARLSVGPNGKPVRMVGTVQDVTDERDAERGRRIAETLQRSMLPDLPDIPGIALAARYVPATSDVEVGGDWYDVIQLPDGDVAVVIGDVAGHGLRAASTMGQLRMAIRAYALEDRSPARVVARAHHLLRKLLVSEMATLIYLVFDPDAERVTLARAGHPPPLLITDAGDARFVEEGLAPPVAAPTRPKDFIEASFLLPSGSTLLLFTDGLVERRGVSLQLGLERLKEAGAAMAGSNLDALCDHLVASMLRDDVFDDVALIALRPVPSAGSGDASGEEQACERGPAGMSG